MQMVNFTPWTALAGGALIGASAVVLLWFNGRIAGISNILGGLLPPRRGDAAWRILFLGGLVAGAALAQGLGLDVSPAREGMAPWILALGGLLVGFGVSLGSGCTSGHGVCGLGRLSPRSLAAVAMFLATGIATTTFIRHVVGVPA